ncbi:MAG: methyltransferase [Vibrio toranzoniae]|uniref:Ribosomal RNA large subunit methyltransferase G n=1 Tax=Vibrio toranzoniae TaxID=1194427 RepID=A0A109D7Y1_9VIBR|nr:MULTISPECIES: methyltransferase [Vibrio]KWU00442.1 50S rRNA methyltransferase [Vibrio toranzoniae]NOJ00863.1 methyltransferase [Vibrio kanaloae]QPK03598.1 methyltransferase [Vibrio kanaloae]SBS35360.1 Ribosomal RNA large subunit methyltransferase G [Vibrio toranzoniae]
MKTELTLHDRTLTLHRFPKRSNETLQAWDAGDEYLLSHVEEMNLEPGKHILIMNDSFGALSAWFSKDHDVTMMSDSFISHRGALKNLQRNQCNRVNFLNTMDAIPHGIDLVIMQLPKTNRHLVWQLSQLRQALPEGCQVIGVNKVKEIHTSTLNLFEKYLGETKTSLAKKKHRLVFSSPNCQPIQTVEPFVEWDVDGEDIRLKNLPNVYSGEALDQGARYMLEHIPQDPELRHIIDLGCGNGVLSVKAGQLNPKARITCVDESFMAVESARQNVKDNLGEEGNFQFIANNCLDGFKKNSTYLVMCNPPFHQQQAITDHIAWQMFCDAKHVLSNGGKLIVIGNRHLGYDVKLARLFGEANVETLELNQKFEILQATREPANFNK